MKTRWTAIFWSVMMILAGVVAILDTQGLIELDLIPVRVMALIFAAMSAFFFLTFFTRGASSWGWLFPAFILAGIALVMGFEDTALGGFLNGAPVLLGIALPFAVIFIMNTKKNWWSLIPAWVMGAMALLVLFENRVDDGLVAAFVLFNIGLPFLYVYLTDKTRRWALIPAGLFFVVGLIPLLESVFIEDALSYLIMFLFAAAFFAVYFWSKASWWALIPAGVFTSIGLLVLLNTMSVPIFADAGSGFNPAGTALLLAGFAITFGVLWMLRSVHATEWAKYPSVVLLALAALSLLAIEPIRVLWPVVMIVSGGAILIISLLQKRAKP